MERKKQKMSAEKNETITNDNIPWQEEEIKVLRQKFMTVEAELNQTTTEKVDLFKQVSKVEQEVFENKDLHERIMLELEFADPNSLSTQCYKQLMIRLEVECAEKEAKLNLINTKIEELTTKIRSLQQELMKIEVVLKRVNDRDLNNFPNEVMVEIFKFLTQNQLGQIARVCRGWNNLTKDPVLWKSINVTFHWSHTSQNSVVRLFLKRLPTTVISLKIDFIESNQWIQPLDFCEVCILLQEYCPRLEKLILHGSRLTRTYPSFIHLISMFLPKVTTVELNFPEFLQSPASVHYDSVPKIEILDISGSNMKHFNASIFSKMPHLKQLYLCRNKNIQNWLEGNVSFLKQLDILNVGFNLIFSFEPIKNHGENLKELYMCNTWIYDTDLIFDGSSVFPQLKTVCLNLCINVTCKGVVSLVQSCPSLQNIYVTDTIAKSYAKHPFIIANPCKLSIVKTVNCHERDKKCCLNAYPEKSFVFPRD